MNLLVVGSINMDLVITTPRMPVMGETITGSDFQLIPGGKGANQAVGCGRLGGTVKMMGCIGEDSNGESSLSNLQNAHVGVEYIKKVANNTGVAVITLCNGDNTIILSAGANDDLTIEQIDIEAIRWADMVILQLEIPVETVAYIIKLAKSMGKKVLLNPAPMKDFDKELLKYIDYFIPNQTEAAHLLGYPINNVETAKEAVKRLMDDGIKTVIITLGSDGCVYNLSDCKDTICHQEAKRVTVVDTTAAGDSFIAGLSVAIGRGDTLEKAVQWATEVAAITVTRKGASSSIPTIDEIVL